MFFLENHAFLRSEDIHFKSNVSRETLSAYIKKSYLQIEVSIYLLTDDKKISR